MWRVRCGVVYEGSYLPVTTTAVDFCTICLLGRPLPSESGPSRDVELEEYRASPKTSRPAQRYVLAKPARGQMRPDCEAKPARFQSRTWQSAE